MVRAGRLNRRVTIERSTRSQNSYGEEVDSWSTLATRWASIVYSKGSEVYPFGAEKGKKPVSIMLRHGSDIDDISCNDRVVFESRVFDIESVANVHEDDHRIELTCVERVE